WQRSKCRSRVRTIRRCVLAWRNKACPERWAPHDASSPISRSQVARRPSIRSTAKRTSLVTWRTIVASHCTEQPMRRRWSIGIIGFWVVMVMLLANRPWPRVRPKAESVDPHAEPIVGEQWLGVFHAGAKIGYARHHLTPEGDGFVFGEESLLRLTVSEAPQVV